MLESTDEKIICLLLACMPLAAHAYPIEVEKQFNGAEVSATTQEIDHNMAALMLYNYGQSEAECSAVFQNGPGHRASGVPCWRLAPATTWRSSSPVA